MGRKKFLTIVCLVFFLSAAFAPIAFAFSATLTPISMSPADPGKFRDPDAVKNAIDFLARYCQPTKTYVTNHGNPSDDDVVPMSLAHVALAFVKSQGYQEAMGALNWMWPKQEQWNRTYKGSFYDHYHSSGVPYLCTERGRGDDTAMMIITSYTYWQDFDPNYPKSRVSGRKIYDYIKSGADFLISLQNSDGRFKHSPSDSTPYYEEQARMAIALQLVAEIASFMKDSAAAKRYQSNADLAYTAMAENSYNNPTIVKYMAYDYLWGGIWDLVGQGIIGAQLAGAESKGLVEANCGVKSTPNDSCVHPSETFDWIIANVVRGTDESTEAAGKMLDIWIARQRSDSSFPDWVDSSGTPDPGAGTSYAAARFILSDRISTPNIP